MPLTQHLYREDEVISALQFCCVKGRIQEATFWCLELLDSGMAEEVLLALQRIWLFGMGLRGMRWFLAFEELATAESLDPDNCLELTAELARGFRAGRRDSTALILLEAACGPAAEEQPDRVNRASAETISSEDPRAEFVALAAMEGKTLAAWGAIRGLEGGWGLLERVAEAKHGAAGKGIVSALQRVAAAEPWPTLAAAVGIVCLTQKEFQRSWESEPDRQSPSAEIMEAVGRWQEAVGRRRRRVYAIPEDCLAWLTARGRTLSVYDSNEKEIRGRLEKPSALWGSQFWDAVAEEVGGWGAVRGTAEAREAFYDTHFPDDCPDEWSAAERAKSHGRGVIQRGAVPDPVRWVRNWFGSAPPSAVIWKGGDAALKGLSARAASAAAAAPWELWKGVGATDVSGWNFVPAAGRVVVPPDDA